MKLNLVTLAVVIIGLSLFATHAPHLPWTAWRIAGIATAAPAFRYFLRAVGYQHTRRQIGLHGSWRRR